MRKKTTEADEAKVGKKPPKSAAAKPEETAKPVRKRKTVSTGAGKKAVGRYGVQGNMIFALDIGTRTVVGVLGELDASRDKYIIKDYVVAPHTKRAMVDGQIEDIEQVAKIVASVKKQIEERNRIKLIDAAIAAAGRALRTCRVSKTFDVSDKEIISEEMVASMEMETIQKAQKQLDEDTKGKDILFYCVGHNVISYKIDDYKIIKLDGHKGSTVVIDMVVAFLPGIVVEGLYSVMDLNGLAVKSLTLEPIAAMNVIVPPEIRLINIALVDIGAGTSDIAVAKDGSITAYAMATTAGDEITEEIIKALLVDFATAEMIKQNFDSDKSVEYKDIFGFPHTVTRDEVVSKISGCVDVLAATICDSILEINNTAPQAVFLVGGGSLIKGLPKLVADKLGIDENHVAVGSYQFLKDVEMGDMKLGAEFITPIGIGVTAVANKGYDFSVITLNDQKIRIFDTKQLSVYELLTLGGYRSQEIMGRSGRSLSFRLNGTPMLLKGGNLIPAEITVNGKPAAITTVITQGDVVTLTPAQSGEDAVARLSDVIEYSRYKSGFVTVGEAKMPFGLSVLVNGEEKTPDYEIQPMDEIKLGGIVTLGDLICSMDSEMTGQFTVNGKLVGEKYQLSDGDTVALKVETPIPPAPVYTEPEESSEPELIPTPQRSIPIIEAPKAKGLPVTLTLNGRTVRLAAAGSDTHTFLELLNLVDIDSKSQKGDIMLTLNGKDAHFGDKLEDGDIAVISWKEL